MEQKEKVELKIFFFTEDTQFEDSKASLHSTVSMKLPFFCAYTSFAIPLTAHTL